MANNFFGDEIGLVVKVDVTNVVDAGDWYRDKLELIPQPQFDTPDWRQLRLENVQGAAVGLNQAQPPEPSSDAVITFVVNDINSARDQLVKKGVDVGPIEETAHGVMLAFFMDPDRNSLGLRQNASNQPSAAFVGRE